MYRIGVRGFNGNSYARSQNEVTVGVDCLWVELPSGQRIEGDELRGVSITVESLGLVDSRLTLRGGGVVQRADIEMAIAPLIVYCDADGNPLPEGL